MLSGQIEALVALGEVLEARGHKIQLVSAFADNQLRGEERWALPTVDAAHPATQILRMLRVVAQLVETGRGCDIIHFNVPTPAFAMLADAVQIITRKPTVVGFEAHLADVPTAAARLPLAPEFYLPRILINNGWVARATVHRAARYIVSSGFQKGELTALGYHPSRVDVIPNLVDRKKLMPIPKTIARDALGLPDVPLIVFAGHFHDVKGHDVLIEAFRRIRTQSPAARLVLAWSGIGRRPRVLKQIADSGLGDAVIELGRVSVGDLFSAADVVALPYRMTIGQAAFPGTVLEAMAVGAPIVTTALPLLAELVESGRTGLLARPEDAEHLGSQIISLLDDPALCAQMVEAQQATMADRFNSDRIAAAFESTYEKALAREARLLQTA